MVAFENRKEGGRWYCVTHACTRHTGHPIHECDGCQRVTDEHIKMSSRPEPLDVQADACDRAMENSASPPSSAFWMGVEAERDRTLSIIAEVLECDCSVPCADGADPRCSSCNSRAYLLAALQEDDRAKA